MLYIIEKVNHEYFKFLVFYICSKKNKYFHLEKSKDISYYFHLLFIIEFLKLKIIFFFCFCSFFLFIVTLYNEL